MYGCRNFLPCQTKCPVGKTNKTSKTSGCQLGWLLKGFPKDFKNAEEAVLEHLAWTIFSQSWWAAFK